MVYQTDKVQIADLIMNLQKSTFDSKNFIRIFDQFLTKNLIENQKN